MKKLINPASSFPAKLTENIWVLGNYFFNLFLIKGKSASALVEIGISAVTDDVILQLEALDVTPDYLVMTHPHADHLTGLPGLKERYPESVWVIADGASDFISHPKALPTFINEDQFMHQAMKQKGYPTGRPPIESISPVEPCMTVTNDTTIDLGNISITCIQTWGHSPGSLMVHIPQHKAVIASDSLGFHFNGRCILPLYFTGYEAFVETLEKVRSLKPSIIGLGHQSPFTGAAAEAALDEACRAAPELDRRIREDEKDDDALVDELFKENYRDEFTIYTPENIRGCCQLLVKRSRYPDE